MATTKQENHPTPGQELPAGWETADIRFLLEKLEQGPILVAGSELSLPTIHDNFGAKTHHRGFGRMQVEGEGYTLHFDAGGAMQRTPSGKGWMRLVIEGNYTGYDRDAVRQGLTAWLSFESEPEEPLPWQMRRPAYQRIPG